MSEPFSVPDPLADAWDDMVRRNRLLQARNDPFFGAYAQDQLEGEALTDRLEPVAARRPLTGRPGIAADIAKVINTVTSGPGTRAQLPRNFGSVAISRDARQGVNARGNVKIPTTGLHPSIDVTGQLDPGNGTSDVAISGMTGNVGAGKFDEFPKRIRVFNTPTGELDLEMHPGIGISAPIPFTGRRMRIFGRPEGIYVIGEPDPPRPGTHR